MSWDSLVIVTDADLARFEPEATNPDLPWGAATWDEQIEQAKRTLRVWVDTDYGAIQGASDRLRDRYAFTHAKTSIGGTFADITPQASDKDQEDIDLAATFATPASDFIYLGAPWTSTGVFVHLLDSVNAAASTLTVAYWAVDQWQTVSSPNDGTAVSGATFGQSGDVTWARLTDWERRAIDGSDEGIYWLRLKVSATLTAATAATQLVAIRKPEGLRTVAAMLALGYIFRGLSIQSPETETWTARANEYMEDARTLYERIKMSGYLGLDVDASGAVTPSERGPASAGAAVVGRMPRA